MLAEVTDYQTANFSRFCEALEITPDSESSELGPLMDVLRWSALDELYRRYGIEIEELHFCLDFGLKSQPELIVSPLSNQSPTFWRPEQSAQSVTEVNEFKVRLEPAIEHVP